MTKKIKSGKIKKKSTFIKISNKNYNRKLKAGKIKPRNKLPKTNKNNPVTEGENTGDLDLNDCSSQKRKYEEDNEFNIEDYERIPRTFNLKKMKYLLPLKDESGLIPQAVEIQENLLNLEDETMNYENPKHDTPQVSTVNTHNLSFIELCVMREKKLEELKVRIGVLCSSVVENPEENIRLLKDLLTMLDIRDPGVYLSVRKLVCLSLVEVFKDILPNYRIRNNSNKEQGQKMKKETRQLREHEDSMLRYYKQFLCKLEKMLDCLKSKNKVKLTKFSNGKVKADLQIAILAIKCFSELLLAHPNFNFSNNVLKIIVDKMLHKNAEISQVSCDTIKKLFKGDKIGESSLEGVKLIKKLIKSRNFNVSPDVLQTFLSLNVKEAQKPSENSKKIDYKKEKLKIKMMSKKEKKQKKRMKELENELLEAAAEESKSKKSKYHTDILNEVFLIYFKVLKGDFNLSLLRPVLEGLARFTHLINIDYFDDLISVLYQILQSGKLGYTETLNCLKSVFTILSGQGGSLNIDPQGFYQHLYKCLLQLSMHMSNEDVMLLLQCIDLMIIQRRKKITTQRVFAFLKRLAIIALSQIDHVTLSLLCVIRQLFMNFKQCEILLDSENTGKGLYDPGLDDPEYCHADSTVLWELHLMTCSSNPVVAKYAKHLLMNCPTQGQAQLHPFLALKSPSDILHKFKDIGTANATLQPQKFPKSGHVKKLHLCITDINSLTSQAVVLANEK